MSEAKHLRCPATRWQNQDYTSNFCPFHHPCLLSDAPKPTSEDFIFPKHLKASLTGKHHTWPACWSSVTPQEWAHPEDPSKMSCLPLLFHGSPLVPSVSWHFHWDQVPLSSFINSRSGFLRPVFLMSSKDKLPSWLVIKLLGSCYYFISV